MRTATMMLSGSAELMQTAWPSSIPSASVSLTSLLRRRGSARAATQRRIKSLSRASGGSGRSVAAAEQGRRDVESLGAGRRERHGDPAERPRGDQPASQCDDALPRLDQQPVAAGQRLADRYQRVIGCQYFEHAERGAEAVRRTFQRNRLGERDSDRRDLEKPYRRLQAPVVMLGNGGGTACFLFYP